MHCLTWCCHVFLAHTAYVPVALEVLNLQPVNAASKVILGLLFSLFKVLIWI